MSDETNATKNWCMSCGTLHALERRCPGDLPATGDERAGWTILARTPNGPCRFQVLLAPSHDLWRARVQTCPDTIWVVPGGAVPLKFIGRHRRDAERQAIDFIERHCKGRGFPMQREAAALWTRPQLLCDSHDSEEAPAQRKQRFLPIRFGLGGPAAEAGTGNLSETGLFVVTDDPVEPGTQLRLVLEVDDVPIPLLGEVRWRRTEHEVGGVPGMGIQLREPPRPYLRYVRNLP